LTSFPAFGFRPVPDIGVVFGAFEEFIARIALQDVSGFLKINHAIAARQESARPRLKSYLKHVILLLADERSALPSEASLAFVRIVPMSPWLRFGIVCIESGPPPPRPSCGREATPALPPRKVQALTMPEPCLCNGSSQDAIFKLCRQKFVPEAMRSNKRRKAGVRGDG
jgi:hypothetical protein